VLTWIAVLAVGLGSYAFRLTPLLLGARVRLRQTTQDMLRHAGMGGMAALVVSSVVGFGTSGGPAAVASATVATAAAAVVAWRGGSMAVVMLAGGAVYAVAVLAAVILG
jgi:branched-subunit amino acid transport protein